MLSKQAPAPVQCRQLAVRHVSYITNKESLKTLVRRHKTSEREERMDITTALTPVREYMAGFTLPTMLRASLKFPGGRYITTNKQTGNPSAFAYEPHTVFLLESRYDVKYGIGRVDAPAHITGVCRTADFEEVVKMFNSQAASGECLEYMDNARWPWLKAKSSRPIQWWSSPQEREEVLDELKTGLTAEEKKAMEDTIEATTRESERDVQEKKDLRRQLAQTAAVAERVSEEQKLALIETDIKPLQGKVPFEVEFEDGRVEHPSGFEPPTPADKYMDNEYHLSPHPASKIAAALRRRQIASASEHHSDPSPKVEQWNAIKEGTLLMSNLTGIVAGGFEAATQPRDAKIPTEIHGVQDNAVAQPMQHASGFVPPTPKMARGETSARTHVVPGEHATTEPPRAPERSPMFASGDSMLTEAQEIEAIQEAQKQLSNISPSVIVAHDQAVAELRLKYFEHIKDKPFWRPLLTLTTSTRPLAQSLLRLSRGLSRGKPFYAAIDNVDRKSKASYAARMRSMRIDRMRTLATEMAQVLAGARGGLVGIRFGVYDRGRGIDGEGLDKPIEWKNRVIGVGVGEWYSLSDEVAESFKILGKEEVAEIQANDPEAKDKGPFLVYKFDEWGTPVEGSPEFPWPETDLMTDEIREGMQVMRAIGRLEQLLKSDIAQPHRGYVAFPPEVVDKETLENSRTTGLKRTDLQKLVALCKDTEVPIHVGITEGPLPQLDGYVIMEKQLARSAIMARVEALYSKYMQSIAAARIMRGTQVLYPPTSIMLDKGGHKVFVPKETFDGEMKNWEPKEEDELDEDLEEDFEESEGARKSRNV